MVNLAVLTDYNDKFIGVIGQDYKLGKIYYRVRNKFYDDVLNNTLSSKFYKEIDEDELIYEEEIDKHDSDYLEAVLGSLEKIKTKDFFEDLDGQLRQLVSEKFIELQ